MKRVLVITMLFGLLAELTVMVGCSKVDAPQAIEITSDEEEVFDLGKGVILKMVLIPSGKFVMGSTKKELETLEEELKQESKGEAEADMWGVDRAMEFQGRRHEVTLTKPFYMGKYEVTQEQWEAVMGNNPSREKGAKLPATNVSWDDCQRFIMKLNVKTNGGYRLPTEAEWEYACKAGTKTVHPFGAKITPKDANYYDSKIRKAVIVGSYKPNAFGLYDMQGNVAELCSDWHGDYRFAVTDPKGPARGEDRVLRGGDFNSFGCEVRPSFRYGIPVVEPLGPRDENDHKYGGPATMGLRLAGTVLTEADIAAFTIAKLEKEMVLIPAGKFMMGSTKKELEELPEVLKKECGREKWLIDLFMGNQGKQYEVTVTKPFYMGKYEVTQEQWEAVMGDNHKSGTRGQKLPVTKVSWKDCQEFIKELNAKTDGGYRLPTEAEWEYACRAGTTTLYSFGDEITPKDANYKESNIGKPMAGGSYKPNPFGLYDMHGNVAEWCEAWDGNYPEGTVKDAKFFPWGIIGNPLRGGSFFKYASTARSSFREFTQPDVKFSDLGFRLAKTP